VAGRGEDYEEGKEVGKGGRGVEGRRGEGESGGAVMERRGRKKKEGKRKNVEEADKR